jgi:hypothetical protein
VDEAHAEPVGTGVERVAHLGEEAGAAEAGQPVDDLLRDVERRAALEALAPLVGDAAGG